MGYEFGRLIFGGAYFRNFTVPTVAYNKPWSLDQDPKTDHLSALRASLSPLCRKLVDKKKPSGNQGIFQTAICTEFYQGEYKSTKRLDKRC